MVRYYRLPVPFTTHSKSMVQLRQAALDISRKRILLDFSNQQQARHRGVIYGFRANYTRRNHGIYPSL